MRLPWKQQIRCRQNEQVRGHQGGGAEALMQPPRARRSLFWVHPGFLWVQSQRTGQLRRGTRGIGTPGSTSRLDDIDQMHLFKMPGFLPSSEPAIGRSQELATDGWCRRTAELPLLVELERAACPQKSRKDQKFPPGVDPRRSAVVPCKKTPKATRQNRNFSLYS